MATASLETRENRRAWGFVTPALLWTVAFFVIPFIVMAAISLATRKG
ncbi:MAG: ABC transporter permease, partial [Thalassospira sp.]|nr:ABC transporter permease [Thalassospira sp.]